MKPARRDLRSDGMHKTVCPAVHHYDIKGFISTKVNCICFAHKTLIPVTISAASTCYFSVKSFALNTLLCMTDPFSATLTQPQSLAPFPALPPLIYRIPPLPPCLTLPSTPGFFFPYASMPLPFSDIILSLWFVSRDWKQSMPHAGITSTLLVFFIKSNKRKLGIQSVLLRRLTIPWLQYC